jgi:hypothetical protein
VAPAGTATLLALAGAADGAEAAGALEALAGALERRGVRARVLLKRRSNALRKAARAAGAAGDVLVVVGGGERAAGAAARGLAGSATPLYVLRPGAVQAVSPAPEDAAPASLGHVVARGARGARGGREGRVFLGRAAAVAAGAFKPVEVEVHLDGTAFWHGPAVAVEVRNLALPGTAPHLAALEVGILPPAAPGAAAAPALRARAATVELRARPRLPVQADGKAVGTTPATFSTRPGAFLLVPAAPPAPPAPPGAGAIVPRPPALPVPVRGPDGANRPWPAGRLPAPLAIGAAGALLRRARPLAVPLAAAAGGAVLGVLVAPFLGWLRRRPG